MDRRKFLRAVLATPAMLAAPIAVAGVPQLTRPAPPRVIDLSSVRMPSAEEIAARYQRNHQQALGMLSWNEPVFVPYSQRHNVDQIAENLEQIRAALRPKIRAIVEEFGLRPT